MSNKKGDLTLFLPGTDGWEVWTGSNASGFQLKNASGEKIALNVSGLPSGGLHMALPVRQISALPFRAPTSDIALLGDLATMHLEQNGIRPALDGGQLTDHFVYGTEVDSTLLTAVLLSPLEEGQLPRRSPQAFDLSVRCLPLVEENVVIWRELGRWVFALGKPGQALYFQCLSSEHLDERAGNEIKLAITQLQIQGLLEEVPTGAVIWTNESASDARPEEIESISRGLGGQVQTVPRPAPTWPTPPSRLLPADVRAERVAKKNRRNRNILIAALVMAYLGLLAFLYLRLDEAKKEAQIAQNKYNDLGPGVAELQEHEAKWDELSPVVMDEYYPLELLLGVYRALPNENGVRYVRLTTVECTNQYKLNDEQLVLEPTIVIEGQTSEENEGKIPDFIQNLKESNDLNTFKEWSFPAQKKDNRSGFMTFKYEGKAIPQF